MKKGKYTSKYLKAFYVRVAFGIVELEIRQSDTLKITASHENMSFKNEAVLAAEYILSNYILPKDIEIVIHNTEISTCDTFPLHISAATILGIFDICESPLSEEDRQRLDRFVLLNDQKDEIDFSGLKLIKDKGVF